MKTNHKSENMPVLYVYLNLIYVHSKISYNSFAPTIFTTKGWVVTSAEFYLLPLAGINYKIYVDTLKGLLGGYKWGVCFVVAPLPN